MTKDQADQGFWSAGKALDEAYEIYDVTCEVLSKALKTEMKPNKNGIMQTQTVIRRTIVGI